MKTIEVVAAIIRHNNKVFTTRRGYGEFENMWEFPLTFVLNYSNFP